MARRRKKGAEKSIARKRIHTLLGRADAESHGPDADLADRYAHLARRVAMRYQLPLGSAAKARICRACHAYQVPGRTRRVRVHAGRVVTTCLRCGHVTRRPLHGRPERP